MRGQLDGLTGRVLIMPSRAFGGRGDDAAGGSRPAPRGRFEEDVAPVRFDPLPARRHAGHGSRPRPGPSPSRRPARLAALGFFAGLAILAGIVVWLAAAR